jgi:preprotein translocase subunit SecD
LENGNFAPVLILLALGGAILYLHLTGGSALNRLYLTAVLVVVSLLLLVPSFSSDLPGWWKAYLPTPKIQLGLDLQGGTHLLLDVKLDEAVKNALSRRADDLKRELKTSKIAFSDISFSGDSVQVKLTDRHDRSAFEDIVAKDFTDMALSSSASEGEGVNFSLAFRPRDLTQLRASAMDQALETIRNRIDQLGVRETTVAKEGQNEILVQLPGIQDPERAKELIGKTAVLEFKIVDDSHGVDEAVKEGAPPGDEILYGSPERGGRQPYLVESPLLMTGDTVTDARVRPGSRLEGPYVSVDLDQRGARIFDALTAENVGRRLAIILDKTVYSAPVIKERIPGGKVSITGRF